MGEAVVCCVEVVAYGGINQSICGDFGLLRRVALSAMGARDRSDTPATVHMAYIRRCLKKFWKHKHQQFTIKASSEANVDFAGLKCLISMQYQI